MKILKQSFCSTLTTSSLWTPGVGDTWSTLGLSWLIQSSLSTCEHIYHYLHVSIFKDTPAIFHAFSCIEQLGRNCILFNMTSVVDSFFPFVLISQGRQWDLRRNWSFNEVISLFYMIWLEIFWNKWCVCDWGNLWKEKTHSCQNTIFQTCMEYSAWTIIFIGRHRFCHKSRLAKDEKTKRQRPKREFDIVMSGQFHTFAMFTL